MEKGMFTLDSGDLESNQDEKDDGSTDVPVDIDSGETHETEDAKTGSDEEKKSEPVDKIEDELVVTIGDEKPTSGETESHPAPEWVKNLRKSYKEDKRRIRELEQKIASQESGNEPMILGPKPTLEKSDFDQEVFEKSLLEWFDRKRQIDDKHHKERKIQEEANLEHARRISKYDADKVKLKVKDFQSAENNVLNMFNEQQQGIILQGSDNPALLVYAIGKNEERTAKLSAEKDPIKFIFNVAKVEAQMKVTNRKDIPSPENTPPSGDASTGVVDSTLDKLRSEAAKTGDYTKVRKYKSSKRE